MMAAGTYNITLEQGSTFRLRITLRSGTEVVDLTGFTGRMQVRQRYTDAEPLIAADEANGGVILGGVDGTIDLLIPAEDTAALDVRRGVYDLEIESANGDVTRVLQGKVTVSREVTR